MIVFNSSAHGYSYKEPRKAVDPKHPNAEQPERKVLILKPGLNNVPAEFEEVAKSIIAKYPKDLSEGGGVSTAELAAKDSTIAAQSKEIALLKKQITNLQRLVEGGAEAPAETPDAPASGKRGGK